MKVTQLLLVTLDVSQERVPLQSKSLYSTRKCKLRSEHWPFQCWGYFCPKHKDAKIFEKHLNPVMLVLIRKPSLSTLGWVPICQGFSHFSAFLYHFVLAKLATSSIRVKGCIVLASSGSGRHLDTQTLKIVFIPLNVIPMAMYKDGMPYFNE